MDKNFIRGLEHAHNAYKRFTADDELLQVYEAREKRIRDEASRLADAKEEGLQKGMQKGIYETARKMKELGVSVDIIYKSTGLEKSEIGKI